MRRVFNMAQVLVAATVLGACYRSTLAPQAETVRLTYTADQVRGCESKGVIATKDRQGGLFGQGVAAKNIEINLRNAARHRGANTVLVAARTNGYWGSSAQGEAFSCTTLPTPAPHR
jgi:hypothetical protein